MKKQSVSEIPLYQSIKKFELRQLVPSRVKKNLITVVNWKEQEKKKDVS